MNASELIDKQIADANDWRSALLTRLRALIHEADGEIGEDWKWETGIFTRGGMVCAMAPFKDHVKLNFFQGAALADPHALFNAGLDAKKTRAIDFSEGGTIDEAALKDLVRAAVAQNLTRK